LQRYIHCGNTVCRYVPNNVMDPRLN
jgi:hypothetical protein